MGRRILGWIAAGGITLLSAGAALAITDSSGMKGRSGRTPAQLTAHSRGTGHFEYVVSGSAIYVYSIDKRNALVDTISVPQLHGDDHGVVASPRTGMLYVSYGNEGPPGGSLLALNLRTNHVVWTRTYSFGIDSMAISPDGRTIYMPAGEKTTDGSWRLIDAKTGAPTGAVISGGAGAHNTIISTDGRHLYLGGVGTPYLDVASTTSNRVVERIGPLNGPGVRPFTINGTQTLAFTTATSFLGFQVSSIRTGKVLYTVPVPGFTVDPAFGRTPDHGISLSPDERELYLIDTPNGYVHVFDIRGLPSSPPQDVTNIKLAHPPPNDGWLQASRDGRYLYVGRAGDVINTKTRTVVAYLPPLQATADFLEIDWRGGLPVATTSRYGVGYVRRR